MGTKYEIVKYSPELKSQIVELQTHLWSPDLAVNTAYLEWKYEQNPYLDTPPIYLALCAGKAVGMRGMCGAKWEVGHPSQILPVLCAGDSVTAPEHRRRGLYKRITSVVLNDLDKMGYTYIFSLSTGPVTLPGSLAMGWRSIGSLQLVSRKATQETTSSEGECPFNYLDKASEDGLNLSRYVSVEPAPRPREMAELIGRIGYDGRIGHVRDEQYFDWRFKNPLCRYRFLFWKDTSLEGYLVLRSPNYRNRSEISIVDWEATNLRVQSDLLEAAIISGNFDVLEIWSATLSDEVKKLLEKAGFGSQEIKNLAEYHPAVLVRPVKDEMLKTDWVIANRRLLDLDNWDLRMIYSEGY